MLPVTFCNLLQIMFLHLYNIWLHLYEIYYLCIKYGYNYLTIIFEWNIVTYCYICITLEFYLSFGWKLCLVPVWPGTESADLDDREMRRVCHKWEQAICVMLHLMSVDLQNKIIMQAIVVLNSITLRLQNSCYITPMELLYSR